MTILGIIATVALTTLKFPEFKQKALRILARGVVSKINDAYNIILINQCSNGILTKIYSPSGDEESSDISSQKHLFYVAAAFQKYLPTVRGGEKCASSSHSDDFDYCYLEYNGIKDSFTLKTVLG